MKKEEEQTKRTNTTGEACRVSSFYWAHSTHSFPLASQKEMEKREDRGPTTDGDPATQENPLLLTSVDRGPTKSSEVPLGPHPARRSTRV